ncbi:hypothetical protein C8Q76DRAFT_86342 [Earliella scabrosa]|nr:hypothetical protein C8Q76DRAFT_86342 [Earliella scabrosa]
MDSLHDHYQSYSWHQSHDQATVLLLLPYETVEEDVSVVIDENYLVAGVRGQPPVVKGQLYGKVDTTASVWQLEPRPSRLSARERTTSTTSTASTQSSYAVISEPEISSSFAASLEAGLISGSDADDTILSSPALSSPISSSADEHLGLPSDTRHIRRTRLSTSPPARLTQGMAHASSFSSLESLHTGSGRLLTIHLEKADSIIWPSMIVGPVPDHISAPPAGVYPWLLDNAVELQYNMDPTSLVLIALDLYDIRKAKEDAFEYFIRAWHQARLPSAAIRLATHYLPLQTIVPDESDLLSASLQTALLEPATPTTAHAIPSSLQATSASPPVPGSSEYYLLRVGGAAGLAQLFLAAGLLYLEGTASSLLASSYAGLSSLRSPFIVSGPPAHSPGTSADGAAAWRKDRQQAARFFMRARALSPLVDVPLLPAEETEDEANGSEAESSAGSGTELNVRPRRARTPPQSVVSPQRERDRDRDRERDRERQQRTQRRKGQSRQSLDMPTIDVSRASDELPPVRRRARKRESGYGYTSDDADAELSSSMVESVHREPDLGSGDDDRTWYLYLPGLVGAGTALLVVGLLSLQSWRKNQG